MSDIADIIRDNVLAAPASVIVEKLVSPGQPWTVAHISAPLTDAPVAAETS